MSIQHDNHYVPRLYLKRFEVSTGRVLAYRVLVANSRVPLWKPAATKGVAYHTHLYTRLVSGIETDEFEKWLNTEFETPAEDAIKKATEDARLSPTDWRNLIRFAAAQDVRTPVSLSQSLSFWKAGLQSVLDNSLQESVRQLEQARKSGQTIRVAKEPNAEYIPMRITKAMNPGDDFGQIGLKVIAGRSLWLFAMRRVLTNTMNVLYNQRWSILKPPKGLDLFTSDDPVIRLNYYADGKYDFKGGWGKPGTEILFPLSSQHLLYTKIGKQPPRRGTMIPRDEAATIRGFIAEHAHRFIFSASADTEMATLRPRIVDANLLRNESDQWQKWHEEQVKAERELIASRGETR